jgi:hypothetical protein
MVAGSQSPGCGKIIIAIVVATASSVKRVGELHEQRHVGTRVPKIAINASLRVSSLRQPWPSIF